MSCDYHFKGNGKFITRFYNFEDSVGNIVKSRDRCEYCKEWLN